MSPKLLSRREASEYLSQVGITASSATLARYAMIGSGPKYAIIQNRAYYKQEWLDEWLDAQLKPETHSLAHMMQIKG